MRHPLLVLLTSLLLLGFCTSIVHAAPPDPKAIKAALDSALAGKKVADLNAWLAGCSSKDKDEKAAYIDALEAVLFKGQAGPGATALLESAGLNSNLVDEEGWTLLHSAVYENKPDVATWLLDRGADVNAKGPTGVTALHAVCATIDNPIPQGGHAEWIKLLIRYKADINARTDYGHTALALCAETDWLNDALVCLIENGADVNIGDEEGNAPLSNATQKAAKKNVAYLKTKGARLYSYEFPVKNDAPACKAVLNGDLATIGSLPVEAFSAMVGRTSMLVPATPLHLAAEQGTMPVLKALCARKVDWNVPDRYGRSPLELAVIAGRAEVATLLLDNGADANYKCAHRSTPFLAAFHQPVIAMQMLSRGLVPKGEWVAESAVCSENLDLVKALGSKVEWSSEALRLAAETGQVEILDHLSGIVADRIKTVYFLYREGTTLTGKDLTMPQLLEEARKSRARNEQYEKQASVPLDAPKKTGGISQQRGTFPYVVESWAPWLQPEKPVKLADYPVGVYVPKACDGTKPYGLVVSMTNAKSSSRYPRDFAPTFDKHNLIWVGFDPYNGLNGTTNTAFCLAIVYNMLGYFNIDQSRIYIGGYSLGGQMTEVALRSISNVFDGAFFINIGYTLEHTTAPGYFVKRHLPIVYVEGDYDYNRVWVYKDYDELLCAGYRGIHYFHEPMKGHILISAASFERVVNLMEEGRR